MESFYIFPLKKIFKIDPAVPCESIPVKEMDFNNRVQALLSQMNITTLAELLNMSLFELSRSKGFGKLSIDDLIATLKKFSQSKQRKISPKVLERAKEELDEFLRDAALKHAPQIDLVITAFENFSRSILKENPQQTRLIKKIQTLPRDMRTKKVRLLMRVYDFKNKENFSDMPEDLSLSAFPKWLSVNSKDFDADELINFFDKLKFDFRAFAKKIAETPFHLKKRRELEIVRLRIKGFTLEEIGNILDITRERVRQLEAKSAEDFMLLRPDLKKLFYFIHAFTEGKSTLTFGDLLNFADTEDAEIIWFLAKKIRFGTEILTFDKEENSYIFYDRDDLGEEEIVKSLPDLMDEEFFTETVEKLAKEKKCPADLLQNKLEKFYMHTGKVFHREKLTFILKCTYLLKAAFPNGYKIANENYHMQFHQKLKEFFGDTEHYSQRNVDGTIGKVGVLCDRGRYIHSDFINVPPEVLLRIKEHIEKSRRTKFSYKEIYQELRDVFIGTQVRNQYFLQGAIKFYELPFKTTKDYLFKYDDETEE